MPATSFRHLLPAAILVAALSTARGATIPIVTNGNTAAAGNGSFESGADATLRFQTTVANAAGIAYPGWTLTAANGGGGLLWRNKASAGATTSDISTRFDTISASHFSQPHGGVSLYLDRTTSVRTLRATSQTLNGLNGYTPAAGDTITLSVDMNALTRIGNQGGLDGGGQRTITASNVTLSLLFGATVVKTGNLVGDGDDGSSATGGTPYHSNGIPAAGNTYAAKFQTLSLTHTLTAGDLATGVMKVEALLTVPATASGGTNAYMDNILVTAARPDRDPNLNVTPPAIFGDLRPSGPALPPQSRTITVKNTGATQNLSVTAFNFSGPDAALYTITPAPALPLSLAPNAQEDWTVVFTPPSAGGTFTAALNLTSSDTGATLPTVTLNAQVATDPAIAVTAASPLFGYCSFDTLPAAIQRTVVVQNTGVANALTITPALSGAQAASYSIVSAPASIAPGSSGNIVVALSPAAAGAFDATLTISHSAPGMAAVTVPLAATVNVVAPSSLVAFYNFDQSANPQADATGNGNHITSVTGAVVPTWDAATGINATGAYTFSNGRLISPVNVNASALPKMTWGAFVKASSLTSGLRKVLGHDDGAWDRVIGMENRTTGAATAGVFRYSAFTGTVNTGPINNTPVPNSTTVWSFLCASYDQAANVMTFYVDLDVSTTSDPLFRTTEAATFGTGFTTFSIGAIRPDNGSEPWSGIIDNVFVYNGVLSDAAVTSLRDNGGFPGGPPAVTLTAAPASIAPGGSSTLTWTSSDATTLTITPGLGVVSGPGGSVSVAPAINTTYTITASGLGGSSTATATVTVHTPQMPPVLNEFVTSNLATLDDGDGNTPDWIELRNPHSFGITIGGYALRDSVDTWLLPAGLQMEPNAFLVVFASGQLTNNYVDAGGHLHTNFQLAQSGEALSLLDLDGTTVLQSFAAAVQYDDASYGIGSGGGTGYMKPPTPRAPNGPLVGGFVADTVFSLKRGFYSAPFNVTVTSATPDATIEYTTNGSEPATGAPGTTSVPPATAGATGSATIAISGTTTLRARAIRAGWAPTDVDTNTYLFLDQVIRRNNTPGGYPADWGTYLTNMGIITAGATIPADYEMKQAVVDDAATGGSAAMLAALQALPTISVVGDVDDFFNNNGLLENCFASQNGVGTYPGNPNRLLWDEERKMSVEFFQPDGTHEDQVNCGVQVQGGWSRHYEATPKKSLRLEFKGEYGQSRLNHSFFGPGEVDSFKAITLRATFSDAYPDEGGSTTQTSYSVPGTYLRDPFVHASTIAMGANGARSTFAHLYINGIYWGIYNPSERPDADYAAHYHAGGKADFDVVKHESIRAPNVNTTDSVEVLDGTITRYQQALALAAQDMTVPANYAAMDAYLDFDSLIDYSIVNMWCANVDWPDKNWYGFGRRDGSDGGFKFVPWDNEYSILPGNVNSNRTGVGASRNNIPMRFYDRLRANPEFRLRFADRIHRHCFNDGALTAAAMMARWTGMVAGLEPAINAEIARWGDASATRRGVQDRRKTNWTASVNAVRDNFINQRPANAMTHFRSALLYPGNDAPEFSQHGGIVTTPVLINATSPGTIYYTLDGSDPRLPGGSPNPAATSTPGLSSTVVQPFESTGWRYFVTPATLGDSSVVFGQPGYDATHWKHPSFDHSTWDSGQALLGFEVITNRITRTTIGFGPDAANKYPTTYFRKEFTISDLAQVQELRINVIRDDGAILYLNGREIGRSNLAAGNIAYTTFASDANPEDAIIPFTVLASSGFIVQGTNVLAVEVHQATAGSSDLGIDVEIRAVAPGAGAPVLPLTVTTTAKARILSPTGEWSALTEAFFIVASENAAASNTIISKLHYNPTARTPAEITAGVLNDGDFEYLELYNHGTARVSLAGVSIAGGIDFSLPIDSTVEFAPGERVIIASNIAAFQLRHGPGPRIIGTFSGRLSNGGEELIMRDRNGVEMWRFTYGDSNSAGWPDSPDGSGRALELINPDTPPATAALNNPLSWRPSATAGGAPGSGTQTLTAWLAGADPLSDLDNDGLAAVVEFATGSHAFATPHDFMPKFDLRAGQPVISFRESLTGTGFTATAQASTTLSGWSATGLTLIATVDNNDGTMTRHYRYDLPAAGPRMQFRLSVTAIP